jgi:hypothetical protein
MEPPWRTIDQNVTQRKHYFQGAPFFISYREPRASNTRIIYARHDCFLAANSGGLVKGLHKWITLHSPRIMTWWRDVRLWHNRTVWRSMYGRRQIQILYYDYDHAHWPTESNSTNIQYCTCMYWTSTIYRRHDIGISQCICTQLHYWTFERGDPGGNLTSLLKEEYEPLLMPESCMDQWLPITK